MKTLLEFIADGLDTTVEEAEKLFSECSKTIHNRDCLKNEGICILCELKNILNGYELYCYNKIII